MLSLLNKKPKVETNPYPHVLIEEALPWDLYEELENSFPEKQVLSTEALDNGRTHRVKSNVILNPNFQPNIWRKFCEYHTSAEWFNEVNELFKDYMPKQLHKTFTEKDLGARGWADENKNIWTDCQLVIHNPVQDRTTRTPHIDNPMEMWAGLLYMPCKEDTSTGGEFQLYSVKNNIRRVNMTNGREVYKEDLGEAVKTVPYKRNTFIMFANYSPNTVHGVTLRVNPTTIRRSVNIIGEFKRGYAKMYNIQEVK